MIFLWGKMCLLYSLLGCPSKTKLLLHEGTGRVCSGTHDASSVFSVLHKRPLKGHSVENYVDADEITNFFVMEKLKINTQ